MPCKIYWESLKRGDIRDFYCPKLKTHLCLHLNVEYFPVLECQRAYLATDEERSQDLLDKELEELRKNRRRPIYL